MTKPAKLYAQLLDNPDQTISFRDFERLITAAGFALKRTTGSHRQYRRPDLPGVFTASPQGKDAANYQVRRFLAILADHGLDVSE